MKKQKSLGKLGLIILSGLIAGACSPLAPSVSKLSNASASKATPADNALTPPTSLVSANASDDSNSQPTQETLVEPLTQFKGDWARKQRLKPSMELDDSDILNDLITKGQAEFTSDADRIKGSEDALSTVKTKITLVVAHASDQAAFAALGSAIKVNLTWMPTSPANHSPHWLLSLAAPNTGDAVKDSNDAKQMKDVLRDHLVDLGIEFLTN